MNATAAPTPRLRWFEYVVALLPVVLAFTGAIGLAVGPAACAANLTIMRSTERRAIKVVAAMVVAILAVFAWLGLALLMR